MEGAFFCIPIYLPAFIAHAIRRGDLLHLNSYSYFHSCVKRFFSRSLFNLGYVILVFVSCPNFKYRLITLKILEIYCDETLRIYETI